MTKVVHLLGEQDAVYRAIADRLERAGATLTQNIGDSDLIIAIGEVAQTTSLDVAVIPAHFDNPDAKLVFRVHDILVPEQVTGWGSEILVDWVNWVKDGSQGISPEDIHARHWVHIRDATDAITLVSLSDAETSDGVIDLTGRRAWSSDAVLEEMKLLWERYTDALNLTHTVESLTNVPSPASKQFVGEISRPDLGPLHHAMLAAGREEGWRPSTAMRVGLMELFAHSQGE